MKNIIFFDLETTGVSTTNDRIVEICIVKTDSNFKVIDKFYSLVHPGIHIPKEASAVHGITEEKIRSAPMFKDIAQPIYEFIQDCDIAGFNSNRFDVPLLIEEFKRNGVEFDITNVNLIDVYQLEVKNNPNTLSSVYKRYFDKELDGAHGAEADVLATIDILKAQITNYNLPSSPKELEDIQLEGKKRLDLGGKLTYINNEICWAIGKNRGLPVTSDISYAQWFLKNDVPQDFKDILLKLI